MTRSQRIEEAARALLDGSEGVKLSAGAADVMNYWNRYRGLRADLRAALSLPPDAPDEYRRGFADGVEAAAQVLNTNWPATTYRGLIADIRALAPPPAPGADAAKEET